MPPLRDDASLRERVRATVMDDYLLEAMREVDAMLPDSPPIAPSDIFVVWQRRHWESLRNAANDAPGWYEAPGYLEANATMSELHYGIWVADGQTYIARELRRRMLPGRPEPTPRP